MEQTEKGTFSDRLEEGGVVNVSVLSPVKSCLVSVSAASRM